MRLLLFPWKIHLLFGLFCVLASQSASAQIIIQGQINDVEGEPVVYATVLLYEDTNLLAKAISDDAGHFWLPLDQITEGEKLLRISRLGFRNAALRIDPATIRNSYEMIPITLESDTAILLKEATVIGRAPIVERKADRLVFYVENSLLASGGSAWDALRGAPGVTSSEQGSISVNGKGVGVLVNDKLLQVSGEQLMAYLNTLKSEEVKQIEVIANPPARYDAEGLNGLINIVLKKDPRLGWNGTLRTGYQQNTYAKYNLGSTLNYRQERMNAYTSILLNYGDYFMHEKLWQRFTGNVGEITYYDQSLLRKRTQSGESIRAGLDLFVSPKVTAGILYNGNFSSRQPDDNTTTAISPDRAKIDSTLKTFNHSMQQNANNALNVNLNVTLDTLSSSLNFDADRLEFHSDNNLNSRTDYFGPSSNSAESATFFRNHTRQTIRISTIKTDWIQKFKNKITLEAGAKYNYSQTDNNFVAETWNPISNTFDYDSTNSNHLIYKEGIAAFYASIAGEANRFEYKFGIRGENTGIDINSLTQKDQRKQQYFKLFPTIYLLYVFNDEYNIGVDFGRRIQRPAFWELNPFRIYLTPFSYSEGNPLLQPAFTYEFALNSTLKGVHNISFYLGFTEDLFTQFPVQDNEAHSIRYTRGNLIRQQYAGMSYQTNTRLTKWWTLSSNLDISRERQQSLYEQLQADYTVTVANLYFVNAFKIVPSKGISAEITANYSSPSIRGFYRLRPTAHIAAGVKAKYFHDRLDVSLYAFDIFRTTTSRSEVDLQDQRSHSEQFFDMQGIRLALLWKFGRNSIPKNRDRHTGNSEEAGRVGG